MRGDELEEQDRARGQRGGQQGRGDGRGSGGRGGQGGGQAQGQALGQAQGQPSNAVDISTAENGGARRSKSSCCILM